ncbi:hypothetical protein NECAME_17693 [Necator americanus]|uniref:Uncharacterized protein n=1 Tax=Necator americanus TaxID=51031 RepID=W2TL35_NECAM|nr:hypothetical protein NECAME_17693 [Necator americanus]ETN82503.1 hypothetical protein NECAME_17693 [Necator americanus]
MTSAVRGRTIITVAILLVSYLVAGAFVFQALEYGHELEARSNFSFAIHRFKNATGVNQSEIDRLFADIRDCRLERHLDGEECDEFTKLVLRPSVLFCWNSHQYCWLWSRLTKNGTWKIVYNCVLYHW